jgi:phage tail sheath protein FI
MAVFEPNNQTTWTNVKTAVENFLYSCWQGGMLIGKKPQEAYFARCDRTTMTQSAAEFMTFHISQKNGFTIKLLSICRLFGCY